MKEMIFDMDGTFVDLYKVANWLEKLRSEDASPYREAEPLYDMDTLRVIVNIFRDLGYRIQVVSWGAMDATREYNKAIKQAKLDWLKRYDFPYDEVHVVKYGTPKQNYIKADVSILIDDNADVRTAFMKSTRGNEKKVINAQQNIIKQLVDLLVAVS